VLRELDQQPPPELERADRRLEIRRCPCEGDVAEDQDLHDRRVEHALADRRADLGQPHEILDPNGRADRVERHPIGDVRRHGREDVAAMEARGDDRQHQLAVLEGTGFLDAVERLGRGDEQAVVRADQDVAAPDPQRHR
jgi:hypothetical protein